jgi:hypothetical protein
MQEDTNTLGQRIGFSLPDWKPPATPSRDPMEGRFFRLESLNPDLHTAELHAANALDVKGRMWTYVPYGPFATPDSYREWVKDVCRQSDPLFFAIIDRAADRAVGVAGVVHNN